jgi:hypothetical protein
LKKNLLAVACGWNEAARQRPVRDGGARRAVQIGAFLRKTGFLKAAFFGKKSMNDWIEKLA